MLFLFNLSKTFTVNHIKHLERNSDPIDWKNLA